jgi:hypothetical protein
VKPVQAAVKMFNFVIAQGRYKVLFLNENKKCLTYFILSCLMIAATRKGQNKMIRQTIHRVVNFKISDVEKIDGEYPAHVRRIIVKNEKGEQVEFVLFSDDEHALVPISM